MCKTPVEQHFKGMILCTHINKVGVLQGLKGMFSPLVGSKQAEINSASANKNVNSAVALRAECISVSSD